MAHMSDPLLSSQRLSALSSASHFTAERGFLGADGDVVLSPEQLRAFRDELQRFMVQYEFGLREVETKLTILRDEFQLMHDYNPIEHISSRVKSIDSLGDKLRRRGLPFELDVVRESITDIAGIRVTCSFTRDAYRLFDLLTAQDDVSVLLVKDYIAEPKPNGYKSLHAIVEVPVFLSDGTVSVPVEVQFRTIAMDFWASLEHKIYYKYDGQVPSGLLADLKLAADTAAALDGHMARLHGELHEPAGVTTPERAPVVVNAATGDADQFEEHIPDVAVESVTDEPATPTPATHEPTLVSAAPPLRLVERADEDFGEV